MTPPHMTLMGVGAPSGLRAKVASAIDPAKLQVSPATVAAVENAKRGSAHGASQPSVIVDNAAVRPAPHTRPRARRVGANGAVIPMRPDTGPLQPITMPPTPDESGDSKRDDKWKVYDDIGLAPRPITRKAQKVLVSLYRLIGFSILTVIVVVLIGYIVTTAFYFANRTWVTPVALSSNDEKVVALQGQLAQQLNTRDQLIADLAQSERAIVAEQAFQIQFARAIRKDAAGRRLALDRVQQLARTAAATRAEIRATNGDYSQATVAKMGGEYEAGLINRDAMLAGKYQLAQISSANLSLAERQADFDQRAAELATETSSLDSILSDKSATAALSYDVLKIARDYETSKLAVARETGTRDRVKAALERQETIIKGIEQSAYLRATTSDATVALVPYQNLGNATAGTALYSCKLEMIVCKQVGTIAEILPGEVPVKHPNRDTVLRGRMVVLQLDEGKAAQNEVLFAGGRPMGF